MGLLRLRGKAVRNSSKWIRELTENGLVRHIGITRDTPSAFSEMERLLKFKFIQIRQPIVEKSEEKSLILFVASRGIT